jgi:hypothetical protein
MMVLAELPSGQEVHTEILDSEFLRLRASGFSDEEASRALAALALTLPVHTAMVLD